MKIVCEKCGVVMIEKAWRQPGFLRGLNVVDGHHTVAVSDDAVVFGRR